MPNNLQIQEGAPAKARLTGMPLEIGTRIALLIDGDVHGPATWSSAFKALSLRGTVTQSFVFAAPANCQSEKWIRAMLAYDIQAVEVPRKTGGASDPNDIAIGMQAARLVSKGDVNAIALMVNDADFKYVADRLKRWNYGCLAVLLEGERLGVLKAFEEARAEVITIRKDRGEAANRPFVKAVITPSGSGVFAPIQHAGIHPDFDKSILVEVLQTLEYLPHIDCPLVPAIAKLYYENQLGPLTVWPGSCTIAEAVARLDCGEISFMLNKNPGDLIFVLPVLDGAKPNKKSSKKYGSTFCASVVRGGGPFIVRSSPCAVDDVLRNMGYLDNDMNNDFSEAVDVFRGSTRNYRNLRTIGLDIHSCYDVHSKRAMLHSALVSTRLLGQWSIAPKDTSVRDYLVAHGYMSKADAPMDEVFDAMKNYAKNKQLPTRNTYNGCVAQITSYLSAHDPQRRRES